ncbi:MAG: metallophosphoesterase family protein [Actinomycetota bacterium]
MKVAVIADTHTRGLSRSVPAGAWPYLESVEHILHAGDVVDPALLHELAGLAPTTVVVGNCDAWDVREWGATDRVEVELAGLRVGMIHDSGLKQGRRQRMREAFPDVRVVVFGHSHMPANEDDGDLLLFNPGSPTWKRRAPFTSMGLLWIDDGKVEGEIFPV